MSVAKKALFAGLFASVIFYLVATGCTWITFTADDHLFDKIKMKSGSAIETIYFELSGYSKEQGAYLGDFEILLKEKFESRGYKIVVSPVGADLSTRFKIRYFNKNLGIQYFFLGLFPNDGIVPEIGGGVHKVQGVDIYASYSTDKGKWHKTYRAYDANSYSKIASRIIADLNLVLITKSLEEARKD